MNFGISIQHLFMQHSKSHIKNVRSCAHAGQWGLTQIISLSDDYNVKKFPIKWVKKTKDLKLLSMHYSDMQMQTGVICCQNSQPDAFKSLINYSITDQSSCPLIPLTFSSSEQAVCKHVALHLLVNG